MNTSAARPYNTSISNSPLLPLLILSLAKQKHTPLGTTQIRTEYDYIIVGAGSAGSVVANRLSEIPCVNVLLLEAGPPPPILTSVPVLARSGWYTEIDWRYRTAPQKHTGRGLINRQLIFPRGKMLGGTSVLNHMVYVRGNRNNFDDWAAQGATGWSYDEVLPYFKKAEDNRDPDVRNNGFHGVGGPLTVHRPRYDTEAKRRIFEVAEQLGYQNVDSNGRNQTGIFDFQGTLRGSQRCSTAKAYLVPAENRPNLDILPNAMVKKILIENKRAVGVVFDHGDDIYEVFATREVILSAGAINTPQLLMLSGIGPRKDLQKLNIRVEADLPVGLNLQDHAGPFMNFVMPPNFESLTERTSKPENILRYAYNKTGPLASTDGELMQLFSSIGSANQPADFPDYQIHFSETTAQLAKEYFGLLPEVYDRLYASYENRSLLTCYTCMLQPKSRGKVTLRSRNPFDPPIIDPNYFEDERDLDAVVEAMKVCKRIGTSKPMRDLGVRLARTMYPGCEQYALDDDLYFRCQARSVSISIYHPTSTAKMGDPRDPTTVVDPQLRVKNISGLRVVDASIMPIITSGNTNAPTIMIGEKASDIIKSTISCSDKGDRDDGSRYSSTSLVTDANQFESEVTTLSDSDDNDYETTSEEMFESSTDDDSTAEDSAETTEPFVNQVIDEKEQLSKKNTKNSNFGNQMNDLQENANIMWKNYIEEFTRNIKPILLLDRNGSINDEKIKQKS
ncbi:glucose dehydrogenase [FAD, quinone]-like [Uloborus diversus]|uniref:glucose dehydrogenase [FAD, quinone]-like n=1 Tax=Uloborus diversus TaxID=327109 RepID=UPI002409C4FE|nr:glucose dehydrogenase [FAD, quinone]-like [Uloborus diversus]